MDLLRSAWPALALVSFAAGCGGQKADTGGTGGAGSGGGPAMTGSGGTSATGTGGQVGGGTGTGAGGQMVIQPGDPGTTDITFDIQSTQGVHPISPYIYGVNDGSSQDGGRDDRARRRQPPHRVQLGEQRVERRQRLPVRERRLPLQRRTAPRRAVTSTARRGASRRRRRAHHGADRRLRLGRREPGRRRAQLAASNYLQTRFKQNKPAKGSALAIPPDTTDGFVYEDEMVHWLSTAGPGATVRSRSTTSRTSGRRRTPRCTPDAVHPHRHAGHVRGDREAQHRLRDGHQGGRPTATRGRPRQLRVAGYANLQGAPDAGQRRLPRVVARSDEGRRGERRQAPRRRARPALVPGGHRGGGGTTASSTTRPRRRWRPASRRRARSGTPRTSRTAGSRRPRAARRSTHPERPREDRRALPGHGALLHGVELRRRHRHQRRRRDGRRPRRLRPRTASTWRCCGP